LPGLAQSLWAELVQPKKIIKKIENKKYEYA
jgi:hypothetical protein